MPFALPFLIPAIAIVVIAAIILTEVEKFGWATVTLLVSACALQYFGVADILSFVKANAWVTAEFVGLYILTGVLWSILKWVSFLYQFRDKVREAKDTYPQRPAFHANQSMHEYLTAKGLGTRPSLAQNKSRILAWIGFWPFSFVGTILNDPIRRFVNFLYERIKGIYQRISDHVFRNDPEVL